MTAQFQIKVADFVQDRNVVERLLISASEHFGMVETTITSRVPQTIRCYSERFGDGFAVASRVVGDLLIVDLSAGHFSSSVRYPDLENYFRNNLKRLFNDRVNESDKQTYIKPNHSLPITFAARDFVRKNYGFSNAEIGQEAPKK